MTDKVTLHLMDDNTSLCGKRGDRQWTSEHGTVGMDGKEPTCKPCIAEMNRRLRYDPLLVPEEVSPLLVAIRLEHERLPSWGDKKSWTADRRARDRAYDKLFDRHLAFKHSDSSYRKPLLEHEIRMAAFAAAIELQRYAGIMRWLWTDEINALESAFDKLKDSLDKIQQIEKNPRADVR